VLRAVDGDPAVVAVPDAGADHAATAGRVAAEVEVDGVLAKLPLLAQVAELRVADGGERVPVDHGVAALALRLGRLDDDAAGQVGHLAAVVARALVAEGEAAVQREPVAVDRRDDALLGLGRGLLPAAAPGCRLGTKGDAIVDALLAAGGGHDDAVPDAPPLH